MSSSSRASRSDYFSIPACRERKNSTASQCSADLDLASDSPNMSLRRRASKHCYSMSMGGPSSPLPINENIHDQNSGFPKTRATFPCSLNLSGVGVCGEGAGQEESLDPVTPLSANSVYSPKADLVISELENLLGVTRCQLKLRDSQIRILQDEMNSKENQLKSTEEYTKQQEVQIRALQEDLYTKENRIIALEEQLRTQKAHLKEVERQLQSKTDESERHRMEASAAQSELKNARMQWTLNSNGRTSPEIPKRNHNRDHSRIKLCSTWTTNSNSSEEIRGRASRFQDSITDFAMDYGVCPVSIYPNSPSPSFSSSSVKPPYVSKSHVRGNSTDIIMPPPSTNKRRSQRLSMGGRTSSSDTFNFGRLDSNKEEYENKADSASINSQKENKLEAKNSFTKEEKLELEDDFDVSADLSKYGDGVFCYVPGYEVVSATAPPPMSAKKANRQSSILGDSIISYIVDEKMPGEHQTHSITSSGDVALLNAEPTVAQPEIYPAEALSSQKSSVITAAEPSESAPTQSCRVGRTFNNPLGGAYVRRKFAGFSPTMSRSSTSAYQAPG